SLRAGGQRGLVEPTRSRLLPRVDSAAKPTEKWERRAPSVQLRHGGPQRLPAERGHFAQPALRVRIRGVLDLEAAGDIGVKRPLLATAASPWRIEDGLAEAATGFPCRGHLFAQVREHGGSGERGRPAALLVPRIECDRDWREASG